MSSGSSRSFNSREQEDKKAVVESPRTLVDTSSCPAAPDCHAAVENIIRSGGSYMFFALAMVGSYRVNVSQASGSAFFTCINE